jgi:hypothetical protein
MTNHPFRHLIWLGLIAIACALLWLIWPGPIPNLAGARAVPRPPRIRPDYAGVTLPANIAPLNFLIEERGQRFLVRMGATAGPPVEVISSSPEIAIPTAAWRELLRANPDRQLWCDVSVQHDGQWQKYQRIVSHIAADEIDSHLVYRRIPPVHHKWREVKICQRDLTNHRDTVVLNGLAFGGGCVNCHSFVGNAPDRMLIGVRSKQYGAAALLVDDGDVQKIPARFGYTAWHPSGRLAVYSMNHVWQFFHTAGEEARDVIDLDSALSYYLLPAETVRMVPGASDKQRLETYPAWSPDGRFLYFCSAPMLWDGDAEIPPQRYREVKYDLMRIPYDIRTDAWGVPETVLSAAATGQSILLPRISPDGRFLLFCMCQYGCFPAYQPSSDLYLMQLDSGDYQRLDVNSEFSESWHSWSSNSHWIAFSSKRTGGPFTRCYLAYVDRAGTVHKPFVLPWNTADGYDSLLETISVPELITGPVPVSSEALSQAVRSADARTVDGLSGASPPDEASQLWQATME